MQDWILITLSSSALVGLALFLAKNVILVRLTNAVRHEFDAELANLSSQLRKTEEEFKADLKNKELQIDALRSGVLTGRASRVALNNKRRVEAIDQIWQAIYSLSFAKSTAATMAIVKFEALAAEAEKNPNARNLVAHLDCDMNRPGF